VLGRHRVADDVAVSEIEPEHASRRRWRWTAAVVVVGVGAFLGFQVAYQSSLGGLGGALGAAFLGMAIGALAFVALLVGVGNALRPAGRGRVASSYSFAAAGLLLTGAAVGYVVVTVFDLGYHAPVVLQARGEATVTLDGVAGFEPRGAGRADCQSEADGTDVERVVALSLGELNHNVLRADITVPVAGASRGFISLFVDAAHLPPGTAQPMWTMIEPGVEASSDGGTGTIRFDLALIQVDPKLGVPPGSWPEVLAGEIRWSCGPWFAPDGSAAPPLDGITTVDLTAHDWVAESRAAGACEFEPDGSVWVFTADPVGTLQGRPMRVNLDLGGDPRAGDEVLLQLALQETALPTGTSRYAENLIAATSGGPIVSWADLVTVGEISGGGLSGQLTFEQLPTEGTPNVSWPSTLSGTLTWDCA